MFVVDTNVLVYGADADSPYHGRCLERLTNWRRQAPAWYITWGIAYEFLRITTHPRVMRKPWDLRRAWQFVTALLASPGLGILIPTDRHASVTTRVFSEVPHISGNLVHDAQIAILMREHGIRQIYTRDTDFHQFPFLEALDPMNLQI